MGIEGFGAGYQFKMTTMADIKAKARNYAAVLSSWVAHAGAVALSILLVAFVGMPIGQVIFDYWHPKAQTMWQAPQPATAKKGKM
jgi:ABC-type proline/glycine betaine transport system permease subunit